MALAGCYGGPLFNLLIGLGVGLFSRCLAVYPDRVAFRLDNHAVTSVITLFVALGGALYAALSSGLVLSRYVGGLLCALYGIYSVLNILEAFDFIGSDKAPLK